MKALEKIRKVIDVVLSSACAIVFAVMVIVGTYQIVVRYFFNSPSTVSEELLPTAFPGWPFYPPHWYSEKEIICAWDLLQISLQGFRRKSWKSSLN